MFDRLLADLILTVHVAYVMFVVCGLLVTLAGVAGNWRWTRNPWFRYIHLAMIGIVVAETWLNITCPLTVWENHFRDRAGQTGYAGDFLAETLHDWLFIDAPTWVFTAGYTSFGFAVAATFLWAPPHPIWRRETSTPR